MKRTIINLINNPKFVVPKKTPETSKPAYVSTPIPSSIQSDFEIMHGDCTDLMTGLKPRSVDLIVTDPPYVARYRDRSGRTVSNDDNSDWLIPAFSEMYRVLKNECFCVSFYGWTHTDLFFNAWKTAGFRIVGHITFPKRYTSTVRLLRYQHESAYLLAKGRPSAPDHVIGDVIDWIDYTGNKLHPTQKPLSILMPIIQSFSAVNSLVLDPFAGSGSTLAAAVLTGRRALGIELVEENVRVATERLTSIVRSGAVI